MTDFERRLRAAMAASAEPPPAGLLDGIRRRHRRRVRRVAAACGVAVAAVGIAAPLVTRSMLAGAGPTGIPPGVPASAPTAAPGTVLRDCQSNNNGTLGANWKAHSVHAGPVWFIYARLKSTPSSGERPAAGKLIASAVVIAISNGRTAVVRTAPAAGERFRFLASFNGAGKPYTLAEGAPGLTLAGCPAGAGIPESYAPGLTMFWEGYVTDIRGCIPLEVRASPASQPIRVALAARAAEGVADDRTSVIPWPDRPSGEDSCALRGNRMTTANAAVDPAIVMGRCSRCGAGGRIDLPAETIR